MSYLMANVLLIVRCIVIFFEYNVWPSDKQREGGPRDTRKDTLDSHAPNKRAIRNESPNRDNKTRESKKNARVTRITYRDQRKPSKREHVHTY